LLYTLYNIFPLTHKHEIRYRNNNLRSYNLLFPILYLSKHTTSPSSHSLPNASLPLNRAITKGHISLRSLPELHLADRLAIAELLTSSWIWEQLPPAGRVLIFQSESIICADSKRKMDDFTAYDFIGAPIHVLATDAGAHGEGFNRGLSLYNRAKMLKIIQEYNWKNKMVLWNISTAECDTRAPCLKCEDQWFHAKLKAMGANLSTKEVQRGLRLRRSGERSRWAIMLICGGRRDWGRWRGVRSELARGSELNSAAKKHAHGTPEIREVVQHEGSWQG